ncbi:hypothetical protein RFI_12619 [Reticulomyxa filosa]|uniref:Uncharacterized protein n=1 Tax=Reticulomyxa filosa TaxID=46433 RepID=X6NF54_RETFI|nr:hypothetical protein RFI_12619 [Reticulomyxa filosa]|eukprot:ETO24538.1 hypothetical protein RFI_12619 [Reticulomyxa filosa]
MNNQAAKSHVFLIAMEAIGFSVAMQKINRGEETYGNSTVRQTHHEFVCPYCKVVFFLFIKKKQNNKYHTKTLFHFVATGLNVEQVLHVCCILLSISLDNIQHFGSTPFGMTLKHSGESRIINGSDTFFDSIPAYITSKDPTSFPTPLPAKRRSSLLTFLNGIKKTEPSFANFFFFFLFYFFFFKKKKKNTHTHTHHAYNKGKTAENETSIKENSSISTSGNLPFETANKNNAYNSSNNGIEKKD